MQFFPWLICGVVVLCTALTLAIALVPGPSFAFRGPGLRAGIETAAPVIGVIAAYLVLGRYVTHARLLDLALVGSLFLLVLTNVSFSTIPALTGSETNDMSVWGSSLGCLLSAAGFALAAFAPSRRIWSPRRWGAGILVGCLAGILLIFVLVVRLDASLPDAFGPPVTDSDAPNMAAPAGNLVLQLLAVALYGAAAIGFARHALRFGDELVGWFAVGSVVAAFSRVHFFLFPSAASGWVFSGDLVRLGFYLVLLVGALRQISEYQRQAALTAVIGERRRMARDLHDGLAQELAYITTQSRRLAGPGNGSFANLAATAERALDESRSAIRALVRHPEDPFDTEVASVAEQIAGRAGARLRLDLDGSVSVPPERRDELLRILREAITNGVRHGGATEVEVELGVRDGLRLAVRDNGAGFDPLSPRTAGFGLISMHERAEAMGGSCEVTSSPGEGTLVKVVVP